MNSKQFLKEGFLEDAHEAHVDHEVQMARVDCYYAAEHAIVLHKLLRNISEEQGLEGWVASKITLANDYLKSVREHLEYQMMNADADEDDFLPLAEGLSQTKKKVSEDITDRDDGIEEFERGPWYVILRGQPVLEDGTPKRFNWLNGAKTYFRLMMDDDPELAREIKREYDEASDKKAVIYYTKKLPATQTPTQQQTTQQEPPAQPVSEAGNKPGLWANIRAKRERIKAGSGERMRKPGSKGAPSNADLKSIRAASNESTELEESLADEFGDFVKKFGQQRGITIKPHDPKPRSPFPEPENKRIEKPLDRESLEARLKELQSIFDPAYEYSDDHAFWSEQNEIAKEIRSIKRALSQQGVAEGFSDVVKGVKRSLKGKEHPDVVASKHAGRAIGHYNQGDIAAGDKETERYKKIRNMHLKAKGVAEGLLDRFKKKTQQPEDPSYRKGWELCNKDPSADPIHLFRRHGEGLDRNQFMKGFNDNAESRGMKLRGDVGSNELTHGDIKYKEFKRDRGVAEDAGDDLVYISIDRVEAFENWMDSEGLETNVPKTDEGTYVVYDYSNADYRSKMYASDWNEKKGVAETKIDNYKDMGATKDTTHFVKNMTTGKIVSPHRSKQDAEDALVTNRRDSKDEFKIVRARKESMEKDSGNAVEALIQVYNNRDQKIIKTKVFASEAEANRWADRNNAVILKLKDVAKKPALDETSSGSVATVVNPTPKNRSKVGTLFGGTYKQSKVKK